LEKKASSSLPEKMTQQQLESDTLASAQQWTLKTGAQITNKMAGL
jgi:hypothetical protein